MLVTAAVVILSVVLATLAGFAFARMHFRGSSVLFYLLLIGLTLPTEAFIIPLYFNLRTIGLTKLLLGADPAADRTVAGLRRVLDAQPVSGFPRRDHRGRASTAAVTCGCCGGSSSHRPWRP